MLLNNLLDVAPKLSAAPDFAGMLRSALGPAAWAELDTAIQQRFEMHTAKDTLRFTGRMSQVYCSPLGWLIANVLAQVALVPARCAQNVNFEFTIAAGTDGALLKTRSFHWDDGSPFVFRSRFACEPNLHERFRGGLGMNLSLRARCGALEFLDAGYFIELAERRWQLPRWCNPRFELLHRNLDAQRFQVLLRVSHPWFGTLIYQRGEFSDQHPCR